MSSDSTNHEEPYGIFASQEDIQQLLGESTNPEEYDHRMKRFFATYEVLKKQSEKCNQFFSKDALTNLHTRGYWDEVRQDLARSNRVVLIQINFDIDLLRATNNTLLHSSGDELLIDASLLLSSSFRPIDLIARTGGDEFCGLMAIPIKEYRSSYEQYLSELKDSNPDSTPLSIDTFWTQKLSHRIDDTISAINNRPEKLIPFSISYGIAISHPKSSNDPPHDIDSLSNEADKAMYQMKSEHKQNKFS